MIISDGKTTSETAADKYITGYLVYAVSVDPQWPASVRDATAGERGALRDALELYEALERDQIHPAAEYPDLAGHPEAKHEALELAGQAIHDLRAELIRVFPACEFTIADSGSDEEATAA